MKGISIKSRGYYILFMILSPFVIAFSTAVNVPLTDTFHEGEYVGFLWHMRDYYNGLANFPLFVHGGIDYIPSIIASFIYGDDKVIVGTRIINTFLVYIQWVLFIDLCYTLIPKKSRDTYWIIVIAVLFLILAPSFNSNPLYLSGNFLGVRNLFLLLSVWCFARYLLSLSYKARYCFLIIGSASLVLAIFWCYDRGIIAVSFLTVIAIGILIRQKYIDLFVIVISALICLLILEQSKIFGSTRNNIANILYWIRNADEINNYPFDITHMLGYIGAFALIIFCITVTCVIYLQRFNQDKENGSCWSLIIGLLVIQLLTIKSVLNRADLDRSFVGGWPLILLILYFGARLFPLPEINFSTKPNLTFFSSTTTSHSMYKVSFITMLIFLLLCSQPIINCAIFTKMLVKPKPDVEIVSPEVNQLCKVIRDINPECYFGWTNEGVIALMAKKRFCSDFPYVHYISRAKEAEVLDQLKRESPKAIVIDSPSWSMKIGQHMSTRFPAINEYIENNYHTKISVGVYVIAVK